MSELQKETQVRQAFEGYEKRKFKEWKKLNDEITYTEQNTVHQDNRAVEQQSFEKYLKSIKGIVTEYFTSKGTLGTAQFFLNAGKNPSNVEVSASDIKAILDTRDHTRFDEVQKGQYILITGKAKNAVQAYTAVFFASKGHNGNYWYKYKNLYKEDGGGGGLTPEQVAEVVDERMEHKIKAGTATKLPSDAQPTVTVTKEDTFLKFNFGIPKGEKGDAGSGGGGAGGGTLKIPTTNLSVDPVQTLGEFGCNLFDYRQLSQERAWTVNGKVFSTNGEVQIPSDTSHRIRSFSGIKKGRKLTFETTSLEESNAVGKFIVHYSDKSGQGHEIDLDVNTKAPSFPVTKQETPSGYGWYDLYLGGNLQKGKYKIKVDAYYGGINPDSLDRKFVFTEVNGYKLISNGKERNTYHYGERFDEINYQLGVCNLKDLKVVKVLPNTEWDGKEHMILFEVPADCYVTGAGDGLNPLDEYAKMMTNNLCDISQEEAEGAGYQNKPYFVQTITEVGEEFHPDGKVKHCFSLLIESDDKYKWANLLKDTQIIYPLKNDLRGKKPVPFGGFTIRLSNGDYVESNKYGNVSDDGDAYKFSQSPYGYRELRVAKHLIVSVDKAK